MLQGVHVDQEGVYRQGCDFVPHLSLSITSVKEVIQMENSSLTLFTKEAKGCFGFPLKHKI